MRRDTSEWTVRLLTDLQDRVNTEFEYERAEVWSVPQQQFLIDSILRGFDLPEIFLRKLPDGSEKLFEVVDGLQRLTAIWKFMSNEYGLPPSAKYPDWGEVSGKTWSALPQHTKARLELAKVTVTELETEDDDDIRELFYRLQKGESPNAAERRNARTTPVRDFVADILAEHPLWPATAIRESRYVWHEMAAIVLAIVNADGPTSLKGADLSSLYDDTSFDPEGYVAVRTVYFLDRLDAIARVDQGMIRTRWGVVDLLLSLIRLESEGTQPDPTDVMRFFQDFERERREGAAELSDFRSSVVSLAADEMEEQRLNLPEIKVDMLAYLNAFTREGASKANVEARAEVMANRLHRHLKGRA